MRCARWASAALWASLAAAAGLESEKQPVHISEERVSAPPVAPSDLLSRFTCVSPASPSTTPHANGDIVLAGARSSVPQDPRSRLISDDILLCELPWYSPDGSPNGAHRMYAVLGTVVVPDSPHRAELEGAQMEHVKGTRAGDALLSFEEWKEQHLEKVKERSRTKQQREKSRSAGEFTSASPARDAAASEHVKPSESPHEAPRSVRSDAPVVINREQYILSLDNASMELSELKHRWNYASLDCAAVLHQANPSAKFASAILSEKKDRYMLSPCLDTTRRNGEDEVIREGQFVVVELCQHIRVDTIVLANLEFFSSMFKLFTVRVATSLHAPDTEWTSLGLFRARNIRGPQVFKVQAPQSYYRFLRIDFLEHYGSEYYCPVSLLRVYGRNEREDADEDIQNEIHADEDEDEGEDDEVPEHDVHGPELALVAGRVVESACAWTPFPELWMPVCDRFSNETILLPRSLVHAPVDTASAVQAEQRSVTPSIVADMTPTLSNKTLSPSKFSSSSLHASRMSSGLNAPTQELSVALAIDKAALNNSDSMHASNLANTSSSVKTTTPSLNSTYSTCAEGIPASIVERPATPSSYTQPERTCSITPSSMRAKGTSCSKLVPTADSLSVASQAPGPLTTSAGVSSAMSHVTPTGGSAEVEMSSDAAATGSASASDVAPGTLTLANNVSGSTQLTSSVDVASGASTLNNTSMNLADEVAAVKWGTHVANETLSARSEPQDKSRTDKAKSSKSPKASGKAPGESKGNSGGESIFRAITKRLSALESNTSLSMQYLQHSSAMLRDKLAVLEETQETRAAQLLAALEMRNALELEHLRQEQELALRHALASIDMQRRLSEREVNVLVARVQRLSQDLARSRRWSLLQLALLLVLLVLLAFTRGSTAADARAADGAALAWERRVASPSADSESLPPSPVRWQPPGALSDAVSVDHLEHMAQRWDGAYATPRMPLAVRNENALQERPVTSIKKARRRGLYGAPSPSFHVRRPRVEMYTTPRRRQRSDTHTDLARTPSVSSAADWSDRE